MAAGSEVNLREPVWKRQRQASRLTPQGRSLADFSNRAEGLVEGGFKFLPLTTLKLLGRPLSDLTGQSARMKIIKNSWTVVTTFGSAELLTNQNGQVELRGGTKVDQISAKEWISLFMHEAVLRIRCGK